jgi:hypothetical protein
LALTVGGRLRMSMVDSIVTGLNKVIDNRQVTTVIVSAALAHRQLRNGENRTQVEGQKRPVPDRLPGPHDPRHQGCASQRNWRARQ